MKFAMLIRIAVLLSWTISATTTTTTAPPEMQPSIYFTTYQRGVSAFSLETNRTNKIVESTEVLVGIAYDSINDELYFSTFYKIFQANVDGTGVETVLNADEHGAIYGLAFDWIGGNVYVTTWAGHILACGAGVARTFNCVTILNGQGSIDGISLDPTEGLMYWTMPTDGSIRRAGMDGSSPLTLVTALISPRGLTIDLASRRLYWTDWSGDKIQSSDLDGKDIQLVIQLSTGSAPWGIAVLNERIYWGSYGYYKLQSSTKDGQDVQTLYTEANTILHLAVVPAGDQPTTRKNDCAGRNCSKLCVLSPSSYRCLD